MYLLSQWNANFYGKSSSSIYLPLFTQDNKERLETKKIKSRKISLVPFGQRSLLSLPSLPLCKPRITLEKIT